MRKLSKKVIDVSSYQGKVDWNKVKQSGVDGAILKIIRKDLSPDKQFENNWNGCVSANLPIVGVYNYSYATTVAKSETDAKTVVTTLNGRKTKVWLDVEDTCQTKLGKTLVDIINAYANVITANGLEFGVYTGKDFYKSYIKKYGGVSYPLWIARYGANTGLVNTKYQPQIENMEGWQYTSKAKVSGVFGGVDMSVWYKEITHYVFDEKSVNPHYNPYAEPTRLLYRAEPMMNGTDVKWLQHELIHHGCMAEKNKKGKSNVDGYFGNDTLSAVKDFQTKSKITVDGIVGVVTRKYLKA